MTLVLAAQAGENAIILAADSQGASQDKSGAYIAYPTPVRKLFVRNACGILTFGRGESVPQTIEGKLPSDAGLTQAMDFMEREFSAQQGVHAIVGGLEASEPQIWHVNSGRHSRLASPLGQPNMLYFNRSESQLGSTYPQASHEHGAILAQMLTMLREHTNNLFVGPPYSLIVISS
jgi:hypothetical protein